ncbi:MAG: nucleoside hydrolase [Clostridia bacterium]|nr:nucleoside hydrolase [Clostridia bacterium]
MKIWIDTDIGGDIDDSLALLLAMSVKDLEIVGVSTVFENTYLRAEIAKKLLTLGGKPNVPVYAGVGKPLNNEEVFHDAVNLNKPPKTYVKSVFGGVDVESGDAIAALKNAIEREGDLIVVTIGALTDIALLIKRYPDSAKKIKRLCIMGTAEKLNLNEFNVSCDPEAADIVFSSDIPKMIVGLDVTFRCKLNEEQTEKLLSCESDLVKTVMKMNGLWNNGMILHDPLALSAAWDCEFLTFEKGNLKVETEGRYSRGKCVNLRDFNWREEGREDMLVASRVDAEAFIGYFIESVLALDEKLRNSPKTERSLTK